MAEQKETAAPSPNRTNALLAWIFAPITSFIFMNDADEFTKKCAKHSMYFGIAMILGHVLMWILSSVLTAVTLGFGALCLWILPTGWFVVDIVGRIMGAVKANNGELFEVPVISGMVKE